MVQFYGILCALGVFAVNLPTNLKRMQHRASTSKIGLEQNQRIDEPHLLTLFFRGA